MFREYKLKNLNFKLLLLVILISIWGTVIINSADPTYLKKQMVGLIISFIAMAIVMFIDYNLIGHYIWILYFLNILLLLVVKFTPLGNEVNGARRWIKLGGLSLQPSEFSKILLILFVAFFIEKNKETLNTPKTLGLLAILCGIPMFIILRQPALSTTLDIAFILLAIIFVAGLSYKIIGIALVIIIPLFSIFLWYVQTPNQKLLEPHQITRIMTFLHPQDYLTTSGWQQENSIMAIGSGMLTGKGVNNNSMTTVKEANLISEKQTDFIFSVIGEELGFVGSIILLAIMALIVLQCFIVAKRAKNTAGMLIATGIGSLISIQTFINIGVATAILPNTGLPLPFVSAGLSSLLSTLIGIGLVLNISFQKRKY